MPFPIDPSQLPLDSRGLFLVQELDFLSRVLPLFSFDPRYPERRPTGYGTVFRIDRWSRFATAFHVLEDLFEPGPANSIVVRSSQRLAALQIDGLGYGLNPIPAGAWRPLVGTYSIFGVEQLTSGGTRLLNRTELAVARIRPTVMPAEGTPYFEVDFRRWRPSVGERVMAFGFADLDSGSPDDTDEDRPMQQYLYGSVGLITDIEPADESRGRPWPILRIDANWPGGMSGGPVFNGAGHVIGLVSSGFTGEGGATATFFSGWNMPEQIFGSIDPSNPGRFRCWAAFNSAGELAACGQDRIEIERLGSETGATDFWTISLHPSTGEYIRLSSS